MRRTPKPDERHANLTLTGRYKVERSGHIRCEAVCDCGATAWPHYTNVYSGKTSSCGCYRRAFKTLDAYAYTEGKSDRLHNIWASMKARCLNQNHQAYRQYGGRGISVCDEWLDYVPFKEWALSAGYKENLEIDRIDNNSDYRPGNCRWVKRVINSRNTRRSRKVVAFGETMTLVEAVERFSELNYKAVQLRLNRGWTVEDALRQPKVPTGSRLKSKQITL
jgi:hypothetical protein